MAGTAGSSRSSTRSARCSAFRMLRWHYRSRDERLIAFSNAHIYDRTLTTSPAPAAARSCGYVPVAMAARRGRPTAQRPEVDAVVDLILEHARERPEESLGVIAMGIKHARPDRGTPAPAPAPGPELDAELAEFFDESREERFFVKNLERVQGDERDAIILSIGYGKNARGDLPYRFGPLLTEGGERRLNVAVTRAKNRLTLVSSFSARDMDPERSSRRRRQAAAPVPAVRRVRRDQPRRPGPGQARAEPVRGRRPRHPACGTG